MQQGSRCKHLFAVLKLKRLSLQRIFHSIAGFPTDDVRRRYNFQPSSLSVPRHPLLAAWICQHYGTTSLPKALVLECADQARLASNYGPGWICLEHPRTTLEICKLHCQPSRQQVVETCSNVKQDEGQAFEACTCSAFPL